MAREPNPEVVIALTGLRASACHGVLPSEHTHPQPFVVDVRLGVPAPVGDDIAETFDYRDITDVVLNRLQGPPTQLIETLAQDIRARLLELDRVRWAQVRVHKPEAPLGVAFDDLSVTVGGGKTEGRETGVGMRSASAGRPIAPPITPTRSI